MRAIVVVAALLAVSPAHALCINNTRVFSSLDMQFNATVDYLLCLHNDLVTTINQNASVTDNLTLRVQALEDGGKAELLARIETLESLLIDAEQRSLEFEARLTSLENAVP